MPTGEHSADVMKTPGLLMRFLAGPRASTGPPETPASDSSEAEKMYTTTLWQLEAACHEHVHDCALDDSLQSPLSSHVLMVQSSDSFREKDVPANTNSTSRSAALEAQA